MGDIRRALTLMINLIGAHTQGKNGVPLHRTSMTLE